VHAHDDLTARATAADLAAAVVGFIGIGVSLVLFVKALRFLGVARTGACPSSGNLRQLAA